MGDFNIAENLSRAIFNFVPFLFALCFHEYAHGWMARRKGDRTAELMGRLTLNPMAHADPIGTIALPLMSIFFNFPFFGWAKPVPVNERNLKNPVKDMFWIALAGPMSNVILAAIGAVAMVVMDRFGLQSGTLGSFADMLKIFMIINLFLAVFNMIPLYPLDGSKVLARFLPYKVNHALEGAQHMTGWILIALMMTGAFRLLAIPVYLIAEQLLTIAHGLVSLIA